MKTSSVSINQRSPLSTTLLRAPYLVCALLIVGCATPSAPTKKEPLLVPACVTIQACVSYVRESVSRQWIRPAEFTYPSTVRLKIELDNNAEVKQVVITASSGNTLFDNSAVHAVERVKRFPGLLGLDLKTFDNFKNFFFDFSPDINRDLSSTDREAYKTGFQLLKNGKYQEGAAAFSAFVQEYPTSTLIDHGYYWLGESYYILKDYVRAAAAFQTVLEKFPLSQKSPDSLLKLGDMSYQIGKYSEARKYFERLVSKFSSTRPATLGAQRLVKMKNEGH